MKKLINRVLIAIAVSGVFACADDSLDPFRFNELQKASLLTLRGDAFDALNDTGCSNRFFRNMVLGDEEFSMETEFLSEDQDLLQEVRVFAKTPDIARQPVGTFPGSNFTIPSGGTSRRGMITVSLAAIKTALGIDNTDLAALKPFDLVIESDLILTDGTTVPAEVIVNAGLFSSAIFYPAQTLSYCALDVNDFKPKATMGLRKGKSLKSGAKDTLDIKFDSDIIDPPTLSLSPATGSGSLTAVAKGKDAKTFYAIYTAPAGFTGAITVTATGATSDDSGVTLTQDDKKAVINVDNEPPVLVSVSTGDRIGRNQFNEIVVTFNEPIVKAPKITVSGANLDGVTAQSMEIDVKNPETVSYIFIYKDSDNDAVHGNLTILIEDGEDGAGNVHADVMPALLCDIAEPPAPSVSVVTPPGKYDFGTRIQWSIVQGDGGSGGSTDGTVFFVVLPSGSAAPTQKTKTLPGGVVVNDGFTLPTGVTALGSGESPVGADVFADFAPNGTGLEVYFYFVSTTDNVSPITAAPLVVDMN